jgi:hypothetical protein
MNLIGGSPIEPRRHFNLAAMPAAHHIKRVGDERSTPLRQSSPKNSAPTNQTIFDLGIVSASCVGDNAPTSRSTPDENVSPMHGELGSVLSHFLG